MPFLNPTELSIHFVKHGHKFGATDEREYEQLAEQFMFGPMNADTRQCIRPNGVDRLRLEEAVRHFGVACIQPEFIRTFYPIAQHKIDSRGGTAGYLAYQCGRVTL